MTIGLCPGTGDATTFNFSGLTVKSSSNPSFTGGGGGGARGIMTEPQGTNHNYTANIVDQRHRPADSHEHLQRLEPVAYPGWLLTTKHE